MKMKWEWTDKEATLKDVQDCVGEGWHDIIARLVADLEKLDWDGVVTQVKEKFGGLRFYIGSSNEAVHKRIAKAETECDKTCEWCGKPGKLDEKHTSWWLTLCPECVELREKRQQEQTAKYKRRDELTKQKKPIVNSFIGNYGSQPNFDEARIEFPADGDIASIKVYLKPDAEGVYPETFEGMTVETYTLSAATMARRAK